LAHAHLPVHRPPILAAYDRRPRRPPP
jgi:hypothetical protein